MARNQTSPIDRSGEETLAETLISQGDKLSSGQTSEQSYCLNIGGIEQWSTHCGQGACPSSSQDVVFRLTNGINAEIFLSLESLQESV